MRIFQAIVLEWVAIAFSNRIDSNCPDMEEEKEDSGSKALSEVLGMG